MHFYVIWITIPKMTKKALIVERQKTWILTRKTQKSHFWISVKMAGNLADNIVNKMMDPTRTQNHENQDILVTLSFPILTQHERLREYLRDFPFRKQSDFPRKFQQFFKRGLKVQFCRELRKLSKIIFFESTKKKILWSICRFNRFEFSFLTKYFSLRKMNAWELLL